MPRRRRHLRRIPKLTIGKGEKSETLEDRGVVDVGPSGGRVRVEEEDQLREYNTPKTVILTAKGSQIVSEYERYDEYIDMDQQELILRLVKLEERFESFQKQVKEELL